MRYRNWFLYEDEEIGPNKELIRVVARNLHLAIFLIISPNMALAGDGGFISNLLLFSAFVSPIMLYWTPIVQNKVFPERYSLLARIVVYLTLFMIIGYFVFLAILFWKIMNVEKKHLEKSKRTYSQKTTTTKLEDCIPEEPQEENILQLLRPLIEDTIYQDKSISFIRLRCRNGEYTIGIGNSKKTLNNIIVDNKVTENRIKDLIQDSFHQPKAVETSQTTMIRENNEERDAVEIRFASFNRLSTRLEEMLELINRTILDEDGHIELSEIELVFGERKEKVKDLISEVDLNEVQRVWCSKSPSRILEEKRTVLKEILKSEKLVESKEISKRYFEKRSDFIENFYHDYEVEVESFLNEYGKGNREQIRKLKKAIEKRHDTSINYIDLKLVIQEKWRERQKQSLKQRLEEYDPETRDDYVKYFVEEMGKGNEKSIELLSEILNEGKSRTKRLVEDKLEELREQKEQEKFEEELGLTTEENSREKEDSDALKDLKQQEYEWEEIEGMEGLDFEHFLKKLFNEMGYDAQVTSGSNDQGADLILEKPYEKTVVQAKRYSGRVSNSAVQEIVGSMNHYSADKAMVVTTEDFTRSAKELAESNDVELWDKEKLSKEVDRYLNKNRI